MKKWWMIYCGCIIFLVACGTGSSLTRMPAEDRAVFEKLEKLSKSSSTDAAQSEFTLAYATAIQIHTDNIAKYKASIQEDKWEKIMHEYSQLNKIADAVVASSPAGKLVKIQRYNAEYNEAKESAASDLYARATNHLNDDNRSSAQEAYGLLKRTNQILPGYKEVNKLLAVAEEKSTLTVVINPVNYYAHSFNHWGLNNDYVQYELARDLRFQLASNNVKVLTDREAYSKRIQPDRVVDISWNELFMPMPYTNNYSRQVSRQVQTGETADKKPVYTTVYATVYVTRKSVQARGTLECRITDPVKNQTILSDNFPASYSWQEEFATYRGDSRALSGYDWAMINNSRYQDPSRTDMFEQIFRQAYPQLMSRIRSVTW